MTDSTRKPELTKEFFDEAFSISAGDGVPDDFRRLSEAFCKTFDIHGICDPMYVANVAAVELGLGDGCGNFSGAPRVIDAAKFTQLSDRLRRSYGSCVKDATVEQIRTIIGSAFLNKTIETRNGFGDAGPRL